ncbi:MAG: hypothetical protein NXI04_23925 [Planctomycetaceae bacterium]|nr:hypothetical protein [Planctomycetaceae bacterium]
MSHHPPNDAIPASHDSSPLFADSAHRTFFRLICAGQVGLMAVTWPLWFGGSDVPTISLLPDFGLPLLVDSLLSGLLIAGCLTLVCCQTISPARMKLLTVGLLILAAVLAGLSTARLQPWHWLLMLLLLPLSLCHGRSLLGVHRVAVASIYLFAALSRFDPQLPADGGMSSSILRALLGMIDLEHVLRDPGTSRLLIVAQSGVELLAGVCLLVPRCRRGGVLLAVMIHTSLLVALGPWALGHSWGVLLWNAVLLCSVPLLFLTTKQTRAATDGGLWTGRVVCLTGLLLLIPASALTGGADNWLGWQVYSPRPDRVWLSVAESQRKQLPLSLQPFVGEPQPLSDRCTVRLDRWVNAHTGAPLYPEDRYQLSLVAALTSTLDDGAFQIGISTPQSPRWWQRRERRLTSRSELEQALAEFWLTPAIRH